MSRLGTARVLVALFLLIFAAGFAFAEGSYELNDRSSTNPPIYLESPGRGTAPASNLNRPRLTYLRVDILNPTREVIDIYTSVNNNSGYDIAVWCPGRVGIVGLPFSEPTPDWTFDVSSGGTGSISTWTDVVNVQNIGTRPRAPATFNVGSTGSSSTCRTAGTYTVRIHGASGTTGIDGNAVQFFDTMVRNTAGTTTLSDDVLNRGRVFAYRYALSALSFNNPMFSDLFVVSGQDRGSSYEGVVWNMDLNGIQPFGFHVYSNAFGSYPSNYHYLSVNDTASPTPTMEPLYPLYLNSPIAQSTPTKPVVAPVNPAVDNLVFRAECSAGTPTGGTFFFETNGSWIYRITIDENGDGVFDPFNERVLRGSTVSGTNSVFWDGLKDDGTPAAISTRLQVQVQTRAGEVHFPFYDVENQSGARGPLITLQTSGFSGSNYFWDDALVGGTTSGPTGSTSPHTWVSSVGDRSIVDTWKFAQDSVELLTTTYTCDADLALTKSVSFSPLIAGQNATFTIDVVNNGPFGSASVVVSDTLPAGTTFVSCSVTGGSVGTCGGSGNDRTVTFTSIASGATARITIVARIAASYQNGGSLTNTASVTSATNDPVLSNNTTSVNATVERRTDLRIAKAASPSPVVAGAEITYTLTVVNDGPSDASGVRVTDNLNASHAFVSCAVLSGPAGTCGGTDNDRFVDFASFPVGATASVRLVARVLSSVPDGSALPNTASVASGTTDPNLGNNSSSTSITVIARADLAATKTASPEPAIAGDLLTYTLGVTNLGPSDAPSAKLTDPLPAGVTFVSCTILSGPTGDCVHASGTVTAAFATLTSGASASIRLVVQLSPSLAAGSTLTNTATASSGVSDPVASNNAASITSNVARRSDLVLAKQVDLSVPTRGDAVGYTITVSNLGPSDTGDVAISDPLPAAVTFVSSSGCAESAAGGTPTCTLGAIPAGATRSFTVNVRVNDDATLGSAVTNTVSVSASSSPDPVAGNDTASATFTVSGLELRKSGCNLSTSPCTDPADFDDASLVGEPGDTVLYRIAYENFGGPIFDVVLFDNVPAEASLVLNAYVGGTEVELVCPDGTTVYLGQAVTDVVSVDLVLACDLPTATRNDGATAEALLVGQSGRFSFQARID